jgi:hypothetical protein
MSALNIKLPAMSLQGSLDNTAGTRTDTTSSATIINPVLSKLFLYDTSDISDYGIFKLGDAATLTTDDIDSYNEPIHTLIGETTYDLIKYNAQFSPFVDGIRFYKHRNTYSIVKQNESLVNHANIISTVIHLNAVAYSTKVFMTNEFNVDIKATIGFAIHKNLPMFTYDAVMSYVEFILTKYEYSVQYIDDADNVVEPSLSALATADNKYMQLVTLADTYNAITVIITLH